MTLGSALRSYVFDIVEENPADDDRDRGERRLIRLFPENEKHQDHDPDRRRVLQDDRVPCGGKLVGDGEEGRDACHRDCADEHSQVELQPVAGDQDVEADYGGDDISDAVDGEGVSGHHFHEQAAR